MSLKKRSAALLALVMVIALAPGAVNAAPTRGENDAVIGQGTWFLGSSQLTCDRDARPTEVLEFIDQCTYRADSAPSEEEPEDGCIEFSYDAIAGGCRARLQGATKTTSRVPDVCMQGGLVDGGMHPVGPPDGELTIYSAAFGRSFDVPVTITLNGAFATVTGSRRVDAGPIGQIVVTGQFLWNLKGEQGCPVQGTEATSGIWHGHYTFFSDAVGTP